ncbi:MAG TPA: hypothetical protein VMD30_09835, partial [Tepidisphaeraceae bacterium]|nr:hypothetical protein [Tepidisphaeraceae bacterium]
HYKFSGRRYGSSRYQLISVSSSDERGKQRIVTGLPRGLKTVCYVNPLDPADAVLNRDYATDAAIEIGVPSIFVLVGGSGVLMALWMARKRHVEQVERHLSAGVKGPKELKTATSAASQCGGMLLMALVWNGLMGLFLCATFTDSQYRDLPIFVLVIMGMFVLAGLWIFYIAIKQLRLFLGVRVHVGIDPFPLSPGEKATVQWEISGRSELIRQLDIRFCSFSRTNLPIAMAVRGTTLSSDNLLDTTEANEIQSGRCSIEMPADADISGNVVWAIEVEINAGARASIKEEFPIQVVPIGAGQAATV